MVDASLVIKRSVSKPQKGVPERGHCCVQTQNSRGLGPPASGQRVAGAFYHLTTTEAGHSPASSNVGHGHGRGRAPAACQCGWASGRLDKSSPSESVAGFSLSRLAAVTHWQLATVAALKLGGCSVSASASRMGGRLGRLGNILTGAGPPAAITVRTAQLSNCEDSSGSGSYCGQSSRKPPFRERWL